MPPSTSVVISQLEPAVFLRGQSATGEDPRGRRRPVNMAAQPSQLRALLTLHVSKPIRVREITITLEGISHTEWPEGIGPNRLELFEDSEIIRQASTLFSAKREHERTISAPRGTQSATTTPLPSPPASTPGSSPSRVRGRSSSLGNGQPSPLIASAPRSSTSSSRGGRSSISASLPASNRPGPTPPDRVLAEKESKSDLRSAISNVASRAGAALRPPSPSLALTMPPMSGISATGPTEAERGRLHGSSSSAPPTPGGSDWHNAQASAFAAAERERVLSPLEKGLKKLNLARARGRTSSREGSQSPTPVRPPMVRTSSKGPSGGPPPAPSAARATAPIPISRVPELDSEDGSSDAPTSALLRDDYFSPQAHAQPTPTRATVSLPASAVTTPYMEDPPSYTYDPPEGSPDALAALAASDENLPLSEPASVGSALSAESSSVSPAPVGSSNNSPSQPSTPALPSVALGQAGATALPPVPPPAQASTRLPNEPARESVFAAGPQGKSILHHGSRGRTRDSVPPPGAVRFDPNAVRTAPERDGSVTSNSSATNQVSSSPPKSFNPLHGSHERHRPKLTGMLGRALADGPTRDREEDSREFKPGTYTFPICIPLPSNLPPTLHADFGSNKYILKALVQRPGALTPNLTAEKEVILVHAPEDEVLDTLDPIVVQRIWEDALSYVVIISGKSFPIGSKIPIWLKFMPLTKIGVHRLSVGLSEKTDYFAKGRRIARHENPRRWQLVNLANDDGSPLLPVPDHPSASRNLEHATLAPLVVAGTDPGDITGPDPEDALARMMDPHGPWEMVLDLDVPKKLHKINLSSSHTKSNIAVHHTLRIVIRIERQNELEMGKGKLFDIVIEAPISLNHSYTNDDWIKLPNYDNAEGTRSLPTDGVVPGAFPGDPLSSPSSGSSPASPNAMLRDRSESRESRETREDDRGRARNGTSMFPRLLSSSASRDRSAIRGSGTERNSSSGVRSSSQSSTPNYTGTNHLAFPHRSPRTPRSSLELNRPSLSEMSAGTGTQSALASAQSTESRALSRRWLALSQASARFGTRLELPGEQREGDDGLPEPSGPAPPPYETAVFSLPVALDPTSGMAPTENWA